MFKWLSRVTCSLVLARVLASAMLVLPMAIMPQMAWAQTASTDFSAIETWQQVSGYTSEKLNTLVDKVKKRIESVTNNVVTAIQADSNATTNLAVTQMTQANKNADNINQQAANIAQNSKMLDYKEATTPQRADCIRADNAVQNSQAVLTKTMAEDALENQNINGSTGKPKPTSGGRLNPVAGLNGKYRDYNEFLAVALYAPEMTNFEGEVTSIDPETKQTVVAKIGSRVPNGDPQMSLLNPAKYFVDNTTLSGKTAADALLISETAQILINALCGGAAPIRNTQFIKETPSGVQQLPQDVLGSTKRGFCRSYLAKLYALRLPMGDAEGGQKEVAKILANWDADKITNNNKQQTAMYVGTMGALSVFKKRSLDIDYLNSPNFINDAANNPGSLGKNMLQAMSEDARLSFEISEELQYQTMLHALEMKSAGGS